MRRLTKIHRRVYRKRVIYGRNGGNHENEKYKDRYHKPKIQIFPFLSHVQYHTHTHSRAVYCLLLLYVYFVFVCFGKRYESTHTLTYSCQTEFKFQATYIHRSISLFIYVYFIMLCFLSQREIYVIFVVEIYLASFRCLLFIFPSLIKERKNSL